MMPLDLAGVGEENVIRKIMGNQEIRKHIQELGFVPGERVVVVSAAGRNMIVKVKETRVAVSEETARRIMV